MPMQLDFTPPVAPRRTHSNLFRWEMDEREALSSISALCGRRISSVLWTSLHQPHSRRNVEPENSSSSLGRFEVHRPVVPLQNLVGLCQTDAAAIFFRREIEFENLVVHVLGNPAALIANLGDHRVVFAASGNSEQPPERHRLNTVDDDIE